MAPVAELSDTAAPWLRPWQPLLRALGAPEAPAESGALADHWLARANALAQQRGIRVRPGMPLSFVDAAQLGAPVYDAHIWEHGQVPTRLAPPAGAWHDYFNALVWLGLPRTKAALHARQAAAIRESRAGADGLRSAIRDGERLATGEQRVIGGRPAAGRRGAQRDALTVFDENGLVLLSCDPQLEDSLRRMDWQDLFVARRARFAADCRCLLTGHALMHKLMTPYKAICAHVWVVRAERVDDIDPLGPEQLAGPDAQVAAAIDAGAITMAGLLPLPVLGIPGWWPGNEDPAFYNDPAVFRTQRQRRRAQ